MLDIIKDGIKLSQSLALLPLKAARRLADDKNTGAKQMVDVAEDFVSMPFVTASRALDNSCNSCAKINRNTDGNMGHVDNNTAQRNNENHEGACTGGPGVRNILVNPDVTVFSDVEVKPGERRAILNVQGLLCGG